jgi:tryptophan synthase beta chain
MMEKARFDLDPKRMPDRWYNIAADLPKPPPPPLHPVTNEPLHPDDLRTLFADSLIEQELTMDRYVAIPGQVMDMYGMYRPSPLFRARRLEKALQTPARIYYKYEGVSPPGSHKTNTAIAQAYYNAQAGVKRLTTETGAGQWGCALSFACQLFDIECRVYMVRVSFQQKPYRKTMMETWGAKASPSPGLDTEVGRQALALDPDTPGSLGIAIAEAVEDAAAREDSKYALGSVLNHVLLHQTIIGEEALLQMELADDYPDVVIGCFGGGSNYAGLAFPFIRENIRNNKGTRCVAVEPAACPSLTCGNYEYDYGDTAKLTPLLKMFTLGYQFMPPGIHAGGLRYHGAAPLASFVHSLGLMEAKALPQNAVFAGAVMFTRNEGILPAPESAHAIQAAIDEALDAREKNEERVILFNLSGHGFFDLGAYQAYLAGELEDYFHK